MKTSDVLLMVAAAFLLISGYNRPNGNTPAPETEIVLEYTEEVFPVAPTSVDELVILDKIDAVGITQNDALLLARAFSQWSYWVANDEELEDLSQLAGVHRNAANELLKFYGSKGYGGKLSDVVKEYYEFKLAFLKQDDKVTTTSLGAINSPVRKALKEWFDGLSWKMSEVFQKEVTKESQHDPAQTNT